eukprot:Pgem_evm1s9505
MKEDLRRSVLKNNYLKYKKSFSPKKPPQNSSSSKRSRRINRNKQLSGKTKIMTRRSRSRRSRSRRSRSRRSPHSKGRNLREILESSKIGVITGSLKQYFRDLPKPLISTEMFNSLAEFLNLSPENVNGEEGEEEEENNVLKNKLTKESCAGIAKTFLIMNKVNIATVLTLFTHLHLVAQHESTNKMGSENLGTVFGPTLMLDSPSTMMTMRSGFSQVLTKAKLVETIIDNWVEIRKHFNNDTESKHCRLWNTRCKQGFKKARR